MVGARGSTYRRLIGSWAVRVQLVVRYSLNRHREAIASKNSALELPKMAAIPGSTGGPVIPSHY